MRVSPRAITLRAARRLLRAGLVGFLLGAGLASTTLASQAPVNRIVDSLADPTPTVAGQTTLRAAIAASADGDTIEFAPGLFAGPAPAMLELTSPLDVSKNLTIYGPGDAPDTRASKLRLVPKPGVTPSFRLLQIAPTTPGSVVITGLAFHGGRGAGGGAVRIESGASVIFQACDFSGNETTGANSGGAILNLGTLTLDQCVVRLNRAPNGDGGGIASPGKLTIKRSLVEGNTASGLGGGVFSSAVELALEGSTFARNTGGTSGGIAFASSGPSGGTASIIAVTVVDNTSGAQSGGLYVEGPGAVANVGGSIFTRNGISKSGSLTLRDLGTQKSGKINSANYNIVDKPGTTFSPYGPNDQIDVDPKLSALGYFGGRTQTYAVAPGSPALDRGNPTYPGALATDQRGFPRIFPAGGRPDVGAFEYGAVLACGGDVTVECAGATTPARLTATLLLPTGGSGTVTWTVGAVAQPSYPVTIPDGQPLELSYNGAFAPGLTPVSVRVTAAGLDLSCASSVTVKDTQPPQITVLGSNPATTEAGVPYVDAGATASDLCDGSVTVSVSSLVNVAQTGAYFVTYTAVDRAGNEAVAKRTVNVVDTTKPVVTPPASLVVEATSASGATVSYPPATAADTVGVTSLLYSQASGTVFPIGVTTVTVTAKDAAGNEGTANFTVTVQDTTAPALTVPSSVVAEATSAAGATVTYGAATATDAVGVTSLTYSQASGTVFPLGVTTVTVTAKDAKGNTTTKSFTVTVRDLTPPVIVTPTNIVAEATGPAGAVVTFVTSASDLVDGNVAVVASPPSGSTFPLGITTVTLTAKDFRNNTATSTFTITVRDTIAPVIAAQSNINVSASVSGGAVVTFNPTATDAVSTPTVTTVPASGSTFPVGTTTVTITAMDAANNTSTRTFTVTVVDPFGVTLNNVVWPFATDFTPKLVGPAGGKLTGSIQQIIARAGESRWYKFKGPPGSRVEISLTELPGNFDVVVYRNIREAYNQLLGLTDAGSTDAETKLALLGAEFAPEAYSPEAYSPEAYSPEAYSPEAYSPEAYSPEAYSPEAYSPEAYSPEAYSPEAYSPEAYSPEAYSPEAYSPEAYSPEAYASAQQRSLVAFSASPGTVSEGIRFNTFTKSGEFYIRVRGQNGVFALNAPFRINVSVQQDLCRAVTDLNTIPATGAPVIAGAPTSLIVWDSTRIFGTSAERSALATAVARFATAAKGVVLDVSTDPQIVRLNVQADANPDCPSAKNLVADAIRNLIQLYRTAAPTIADITLIGNDAVIPFFRSDDKALLASEANYFPPVKDGTQSQSSLRFAQVLSQDRYGSTSQVVLATGPYDLPGIPVGRVVETATEVSAYLDAYATLFNGTATSGSVPTPKSAFVAGYDFLADSAEAMKADLTAGLGAGATVKSLISPFDQAPALGWTADQLRAAFLGSRSDISYLAGHFSTGRALAADFTTRFLAEEVVTSTVNLTHALVMSAGCHSGYSTVDQDRITGLTDPTDWAQAFSRKRAILIGGTGYQYGDTDFIEYTERLLLEVTRALRTGSGPVSIGQAMVEAKRRYLAETAIMRGIHEKSLLELVLYGLPMVKFNLPGARLSPPVPVGDVAVVVPVTSGPGVTLALKQGNLSITPLLTREDRTLDVVGAGGTVTASYFRGSDGIVSIVGEPVRALESFNVSRPEGLVRGVGFRGGQYDDLTGFRPFTGAPATETRGVHGSFLTEVFYPVRPWSLNQVGELNAANGNSLLNVFPTQFVSDGPNSPTGILRKFAGMQFSVFYSPATSSTALSNPPAINVVSSTVSAGVVTFAVDVAATTGAGVQEVWVTYTGLTGSPLYGSWQSLTLTPPAGATGIGTWTGSLTLPSGAIANQVRFMVQAVNGVGGVAQNTNFGRFFVPGASTLDGIGLVGAPTTLTFLGSIPDGGFYRSSLPLQARLTDGAGQGVAGKRIRFGLGSSARSVITDANGVASVTLGLVSNPGSYNLEASFAGDVGLQNSSAVRSFTITKVPTQLTFDSGSLVPNASGVVVRLRASDGTPLKERSVVFILTKGTVKTARSEITDAAGQARLSSSSVGPGTYGVTAYFGQPVTLPDGTVASLSDRLYSGSTASSSFTIGDVLVFSSVSASVSYSDLTVQGATASNAGASQASVQGVLSLIGRSFDPNSLLASKKATSVTALVRATLSGVDLTAGTMVLRAYSNDNKHWRGEGVIDGAAVDLRVDWDNDLNGAARYAATITPVRGSGPLYNADPALLNFELTLGAGAGENPAGGVVVIGGAAFPWTQQTGSSRSR